MISDRKFIFQAFRCQNTYFHPPQNFKKGWGGGEGAGKTWIIQSRVGGGVGMFLKKGGTTGFSM